MPRSIFIALISFSLMSCAFAEEPKNRPAKLSVNDELNKILTDFPNPNTRSERDKALSRLAAKAEEEKSTEYVALMRIYNLLGKLEDSARIQALLRQQTQPKTITPITPLPKRQMAPPVQLKFNVPPRTDADPKQVQALKDRAKSKGRSELSLKLGQIQAKYSVITLPPTERRGPAAAKLNEEREAALKKLAEEPATAESTDLATLIEVYSLATKTAEALDVFHKWIAEEVAEEELPDFYKQLGHLGVMPQLIQALIRDKKIAEGWQAVADVQAKFDRLTVTQDAYTRNFQKNDILNREQQLEEAERLRFVEAEGPLEVYFANPLDVARECRRLANVFFKQLTENRETPAYQKAVIQQRDAFRQLALAAEAAQCKDHLSLLRIYSELGRADDVKREAQALLNDVATAADPQALNSTIGCLSRVELIDDQLSVAKRSTALTLGVNEAYFFFNSSLRTANDLLQDCVRTGKLSEGRQYLDAWEVQFEHLKETVNNPKNSDKLNKMEAEYVNKEIPRTRKWIDNWKKRLAQ